MVITVVNTLFLVIYLLSAAVQYNDPDAAFWIGIYLSAATMCILKFRRPNQRWFPALLLVVSLLWMGSLLPRVVGQTSLQEITASITMRTREVEEAREIGGLLLVALWAGALSFGRVR